MATIAWEGYSEWSPRTRGWSQRRQDHGRDAVVVPAHAGVVPVRTASRRGTSSGPRARGGGPHVGIVTATMSGWSPRTRGWSLPVGRVDVLGQVVPAHAGVVPPSGSSFGPRSGGPRARGGGPLLDDRLASVMWWSPRTRGWSLLGVVAQRRPEVVPAHAGVVPMNKQLKTVGPGDPRARGGGPGICPGGGGGGAWSPRTRGWSQGVAAAGPRPGVVPAHAGVVPRGGRSIKMSTGGPRARGGGPGLALRSVRPHTWSPRTRGWSLDRGMTVAKLRVVPAHAGVVPAPRPRIRSRPCGPRARGGGPVSVALGHLVVVWSPRTRGWSPGVCSFGPLSCVVPAHAGVVPLHAGLWPWNVSGPRARGGGPSGKPAGTLPVWWSPRTRGWSRRHRR